MYTSSKKKLRADSGNEWKPVRIIHIPRFNLIFFEIAKEGGRVQFFRMKVGLKGEASQITEMQESEAKALEYHWEGTAAEVKGGDVYKAVVCFCAMQDLLHK